MARAPKAMDLQKDVNSFKDIAKETRLLIRELKQFGETGTNCKIKDNILENAIQLEHAFKNDLHTFILNANKHKMTSGGDRRSKEGNLEELQAEVESISGVVDMLQKQIVRAACEEDCSTTTAHDSPTEDTKMDTFQICQGNNSTVTMNDRMFDESFYLSEDEDMFGDDGCEERVVSQLETSNDEPAKWQTTDGTVSVGQLETSTGNQLPDGPYAFSEPFFTQVESVFEKCVAALSSAEYHTELFEEEPSKTSLDQKLVPCKNEACPSLSSSNRITSSDELCAKACEPIERVMHGMDSNIECKITSVLSNDSASLNSKMPPDEVSESKIGPDDESKRGANNEGPMTGNTKTGLKDGRVSAKEHISDDLGPMFLSVPPPSFECLTLGIDAKMTLDSNTAPSVNTTTPVDKPRPLLNSLQDDRPFGIGNVFNLPIHLQKPDWVLTVSGRLSKSQNVMSKLKDFASVLKCKLRTSFNFLTTHLILNKDEKLRQIDFYEALVSNRPVVSFAWISESLREGKLLPCDPFLVWKRPSSMDDEDDCCDVQDFLLENVHICCIASFSGFSKGELRRLVEMCGGTFVLDPALFKCSRKWRNIALVEKHDFDKEYEHQYERAKENFSKFEVVSKEWLLHSICEGRLLDTKDFLCVVPSVGS